MSICVSWPARVDASEDSIRAAVDFPVFDACSPRHCADWYVLQAVAIAAMASSSVDSHSMCVCRPSSRIS